MLTRFAIAAGWKFASGTRREADASFVSAL